MRCPKGHIVVPSELRVKLGKFVCPVCRKLDATMRQRREATRKAKQRATHPSKGVRHSDGPLSPDMKLSRGHAKRQSPDDAGPTG